MEKGADNSQNEYEGDVFQDEEALSTYRALGLLVALAIRTGIKLPNLRLSSIIWKEIVGERTELEDIERINSCSANLIRELRRISKLPKEQSKTAFDALKTRPKHFIHRGLDGGDTLLVPFGERIVLNSESSAQFADYLEEALLCEGREAIVQIREGFFSILPQDIISLFTWKELRDTVCMRPSNVGH